MDTQESLWEIYNLRLRFQMNNRLRLECLAALSRIFRDHGENLKDELLSSLVFAIPGELPGERPNYADIAIEAKKPGPPATPGPPPGAPPPGKPKPGPPPGAPPAPGAPPPGHPPPGAPPAPGVPPPGAPPPGSPKPGPPPGAPPPSRPRSKKEPKAARSQNMGGRGQRRKAS
jgi:hypothetical protein